MVDLTSPSLDSMSGTRSANRLHGAPRAAGPATSNLACISSKRRRWESNPLRTALQAAAVAVWLQRHVKCPRQESNLVFDLRRVACESGTPRGQCFYASTSPRSRTSSCRFEVCRAHPSHSQGISIEYEIRHLIAYPVSQRLESRRDRQYVQDVTSCVVPHRVLPH